MATGDLTNNVRKLKTKLKTIKYTDDIDISGLAEGKPTVYLPIYHYAFTQYSPALTETILKKDVELFGKSDARFMEAIYKILRDEFSYKPPVNKEQFFAKGFAERKVIMCTEVLQQIITRNNKLNPPPLKTAMKTSVRPTSAVDSRNGHTGVPKTKRPGSAKLSLDAHSDGHGKLSPHQAPSVINELTHLIYSGSRVIIHRVPKTKRPSSAKLYMDAHSDGHGKLSPRQAPSVVNELTREPAHLPVRHTAPSTNRNHIIRHIARSPEQSLELSVVEIQASTSESILNSTVPSSDKDKDMHQQISNLHKCIDLLTGQMTQLDSTVRSLQPSAGADSSYVKALEDTIHSQLSNVMARVVLLENRVTMLEAKVSQVGDKGNPMFPPDPDGTLAGIPQQPLSSFAEDLQSITAATKFQKALQDHTNLSLAHDPSYGNGGLPAMSGAQKFQIALQEDTDVSLAYSPIRKYTTSAVQGQILSGNEDTFALETEDDARRSSTPTGLGSRLGDSTICANFSDQETNDAVARIKNMMKETQSVLATQKLPTDVDPVVQTLR